MKKVLSMALVFALMVILACPVFAVGDTFVPSISYKGPPKFVVDENGVIGVMIDAQGKVIGQIYQDCLVITSIAGAQASEHLSDEAKALLLYVYDELSAGTMVLPAEKWNDRLVADDLVIRDLVDISWLCDDHPDMVAPSGVVFKVTLDLGIAASDNVGVFSYKHNEWNPIVSVVNNGDGTVTCTFEDLCPVAFVLSEKDAPVNTGDSFGTEMVFWFALMTASTIALVVVVATYRKEKR